MDWPYPCRSGGPLSGLVDATAFRCLTRAWFSKAGSSKSLRELTVL